MFYIGRYLVKRKEEMEQKKLMELEEAERRANQVFILSRDRFPMAISCLPMRKDSRHWPR